MDRSRAYILLCVCGLVLTGWSSFVNSPKLQPFMQCYTKVRVIDECLLIGSLIIKVWEGIMRHATNFVITSILETFKT